MRNIAGLDIATTTGLAVLKNGTVYETDTFHAKIDEKIIRDLGTFDARLEGEIGRQFEDYLFAWLVINDVAIAGIEMPIPSNNTKRRTVINEHADFAGQALTHQDVPGTSLAAVFRIYGLELLAASVCRRLNIDVRFVAQASWRKTFLNNHRPRKPKDEAAAQCKKLGIAVSSKDAAEAVGVCWHLNTLINPYNARRANDLFPGLE